MNNTTVEKEIDDFVKEAERRFRLSDWPQGHFRRYLTEIVETVRRETRQEDINQLYRQNTYEDNEKLVYTTTIGECIEILSRLQNQEEKERKK
jgi:transcription initiation factor TFIIIB Brf1 subunit/transcription initiation factor TFIIB